MISLFSRALAGTRVLILTAALCWCAVNSANAGSPTLVAQPGVTAPASIPELARALKNDPNLIYEYVYTNIQYSPTYGLKKGALGTLLDGIGNDYDQSALLVALLREAGYTANFVAGTITLSPTQLNQWLGVDTASACPTFKLLTAGGIPKTVNTSGPAPCSSGDTLVSADIDHVWVSVTGGSLNTTTYYLDPSYKTYTARATRIDLAAATGYSRTAFLAAAQSGSTTTASSVQNINSGNIKAELTQYANNLVNYIRTNMPTAATKDVIGGMYIQPLTQPFSFPTSLPYQKAGSTPSIWTAIPDVRRTTLRVRIGGIDKTYFGDELYGHRLSIVFNSSVQPVLYLDDVIQGTGTPNSIALTHEIEFPFCFASTGSTGGYCGTGFTNTLSFSNTLQALIHSAYAIVIGWDASGRGMVEYHRNQVRAQMAEGASVSAEDVTAGSLNLAGFSWLSQLSAASLINDRLIGTQTVFHSAIGVVGQVSAPYIDMPGVFAGTSSLTSDANLADTSFFSTGGALSALEYGILEQSFLRSGHNAVSTIRLLDLANTQGGLIFDATAANWATIVPQLIGYASADLNDIQTFINAGYRVVLPQYGNLTKDAWTGAGYMAIGVNAGSATISYSGSSYRISPNLKGGFLTTPNPNPPSMPDIIVTAPRYTDSGYWPPYLISIDPIDLASGAFLYDNKDLTVGSSALVGLNLTSSYSSARRYSTGSMGPGWMHSFEMSASLNSDGLLGLGENSPIDGAAAIASAFVIQDLLSDSTKSLPNIVIASLAQSWWVDRLINNTVNIAAPSSGDQFVLLADGSYNPRLGSTNRLAKADDLYQLTHKDGTVIEFGPHRSISRARLPGGAETLFSYDSSIPPLLTEVSNSFGRKFQFFYDANSRLTSVREGDRGVAYGYDERGQLTSFTDPLQSVTTFVYDDRLGLLSRIFSPANQDKPFVTNEYDTLGRVRTQKTAADFTWTYFFAGYRSEENNPKGTQRVLYYSARGLPTFDIKDASARRLVTQYEYDGIDRLVSLRNPEGDQTLYAYSSSNPWANNVSSRTRRAKPGSALADLVTTYLYDSDFNKPVEIVDPKGLITRITYWPLGMPGGGLIASTVYDFGSAGHLNATTRVDYNSLGLMSSSTDAMGVATAFGYDDQGNLISTIQDVGMGRLNLTTSRSYDQVGNIISVTNPKGKTRTGTYDSRRFLLSGTYPPTSSAPSGLTTQYTYDLDGRTLSVEQLSGAALLRSTSTSYTLTGKPASSTDANGYTARYSYDSLDLLESIRDAEGRITKFTYDAVGQPNQRYNIAVQNSPLEQNGYTDNGLAATLTDANGFTTNFTYDGFDRLLTTAFPDGTTESRTYDANSNVLTFKSRAGLVTSYTYDTLNRLATKTPPLAGPIVTYRYDLNGRVIGVSDTSAAITPAVPPGSSASVLYSTNYAYDANDQLTSVIWDNAAAPTPPTAGSVTFGHVYNRVNQRIGQTVDDNSWLRYPAAAPGTIAYVTNSLNQYTSVGGMTPTYDSNGNLTFDGTYTLGYDPYSQLVSASGAATSATYTYDARGRRKSKSVNGATTIFVTDADDREVLEYDGTTGAILNWYSYGLGSTGVLSRMEIATATRTAFAPDILESTAATLPSTSSSLAKFGYLPYGQSNVSAPFGFTGQRLDAELGDMYYFKARHYSPTLGRFIQPDPIGYTDDLNLYAYTANDPLNRVDRSGFASNGIFGIDDLFSYCIAYGCYYNNYQGLYNQSPLAPPPPQTASPLVPVADPKPFTAGRIYKLEDVMLPDGRDKKDKNGNPDYVGVQSPFSRDSRVRMVTEHQFYDIRGELLTGSKPFEDSRYNGQLFERPDGTIFGYRFSPESGPTLDIYRGNEWVRNGVKLHIENYGK